MWRWGLQASLGSGGGEGWPGNSTGDATLEGLEWEAEMLRAQEGWGGAPTLLGALNKEPRVLLR